MSRGGGGQLEFVVVGSPRDMIFFGECFLMQLEIRFSWLHLSFVHEIARSCGEIVYEMAVNNIRHVVMHD